MYVYEQVAGVAPTFLGVVERAIVLLEPHPRIVGGAARLDPTQLYRLVAAGQVHIDHRLVAFGCPLGKQRVVVFDATPNLVAVHAERLWPAPDAAEVGPPGG